MKRAGRLFERIAEPGNLLSAYLKARRGKMRRADVLAFTVDLDVHLEQLRDDLLNNQLGFDRYTCFRVYDPKERIIHAASFPDRVIHHAILNTCEPFFERAQIFDSYACRKGKGTRGAVFRALHFARRFPCYLKLDVRTYFHSIGHTLLEQQLHRIFKDPRLLALLARIIDGGQVAPRRGLPIGNLTSQYFANQYLAPLDHFLKEELRVCGYVRYMDDFVLWGRTTRELMNWEHRTRRFCEQRLALELKPPCINHCAAGLPFLGFLVRPAGLRLTSHSCRRVRRKLRRCLRDLEDGEIDEERAAITVRSLFARTDWANGTIVRRHLLADDFGAPPQGSNRVYRGGSWANNARNCRCAYRNNWQPDDRNDNVGFRLVLSRSSRDRTDVRY